VRPWCTILVNAISRRLNNWTIRTCHNSWQHSAISRWLLCFVRSRRVWLGGIICAWNGWDRFVVIWSLRKVWTKVTSSSCRTLSCITVDAGVGVVRCQPGDEPCYWCVSWPCLQRQPRDSAGIVRCSAWRRFPAARRAGVTAREVSPGDVGLTHCVGESWSVCGDFSSLTLSCHMGTAIKHPVPNWVKPSL